MTADQRAPFERTFRLHYAELCDFAAFYLGSADEAEEVVQEVFFAIWLRRQDLEAKASMRAYLYGAVRNHALNRARHDAVVRRHAAEETVKPAATEPTPDDRYQTDASALELRRAIESLPPRARLAMELRWLRQMSYAEVAEVMRISVKGVEKLVTAGIAELRSKLIRCRENPERERRFDLLAGLLVAQHDNRDWDVDRAFAKVQTEIERSDRKIDITPLRNVFVAPWAHWRPLAAASLLLLSVGSVLTYSASQRTPSTATDHFARLGGNLSFERQDMRTVAADIGNWFGVQVVIADSALATRRITAVFNKPSMTEVLDAIAESTGSTYDSKDGVITFSPASR